MKAVEAKYKIEKKQTKPPFCLFSTNRLFTEKLPRASQEPHPSGYFPWKGAIYK